MGHLNAQSGDLKRESRIIKLYMFQRNYVQGYLLLLLFKLPMDIPTVVIQYLESGTLSKTWRCSYILFSAQPPEAG